MKAVAAVKKHFVFLHLDLRLFGFIKLFDQIRSKWSSTSLFDSKF